MIHPPALEMRHHKSPKYPCKYLIINGAILSQQKVTKSGHCNSHFLQFENVDFAAWQMIFRYVEKYHSLRSKRSFSIAL